LVARQILLLTSEAEGSAKKHVRIEHVANLLANLVVLSVRERRNAMGVA
jgi:hypothetical protein